MTQTRVFVQGDTVWFEREEHLMVKGVVVGKMYDTLMVRTNDAIWLVPPNAAAADVRDLFANVVEYDNDSISLVQRTREARARAYARAYADQYGVTDENTLHAIYASHLAELMKETER